MPTYKSGTICCNPEHYPLPVTTRRRYDIHISGDSQSHAKSSSSSSSLLIILSVVLSNELNKRHLTGSQFADIRTLSDFLLVESIPYCSTLEPLRLCSL